jgi:hypothetical protein
MLHEPELLNVVEKHIGELEMRIRGGIGSVGWVRLLKSMPGMGEIFGATSIWRSAMSTVSHAGAHGESCGI